MKIVIRLFGLAAVLSVLACGALPPAQADEAPGDCLGVDFDRAHPVPIAKVTTARPRLNFIKSAWEDKSCPADGDACAEKAYLVPGDFVLVGKSNGPYSCVSFQAAADRTQRWTNGWLPSANLTPVTPAPAPSRADWLGAWVHAGGEIDIRKASGGALRIHGEQVYPAAQDVHNGVVDATARPQHGMLAFADDGSTPFDKAADGSCLIRMRRVEALLVVEDNGACGGEMVTFTGFYRKKQ